MRFAGLSFREAVRLVASYAADKLMAQLRSVVFIVLYLAAFQVFILRVPIGQASVISVGIGLAVVGLAFFLEGLFLGLMPLGEFVGSRLPRKAHVSFVVLFAFALGAGATYAEPSIAILRTAGSIVTAWTSPLLYYILNIHPEQLLFSIAMGVGAGVSLGILRFAFDLSLKPFVIAITALLLAFSARAAFDPKLGSMIGIAWDSGGVTTGPVTVPLVLALGIGVSRVTGKGDNPLAGFGLITFASAVPVAAVLLLGMVHLADVPVPMTERDFFRLENRAEASPLFGSGEALLSYAFLNAGHEGRLSYFGGEEELSAYLRTLDVDPAERSRVFPSREAFRAWLFTSGTAAEQAAVFPDRGSRLTAREGLSERNGSPGTLASDTGQAMEINLLNAVRAILPLSVFLMLFILVVLRTRLPQTDEIVLGIILSLAGMALLSTGIQLGLARLGAEVGRNLPTAFMEVDDRNTERIIANFDPGLVNRAVSPSGETGEFFYLKTGDEYEAVPFDRDRYDQETRTYRYPTTVEPLFAENRETVGLFLVLFFAFLMGYGATVAEPALSAMGATIEDITVGIFRRKALIRAVSIGVGFGMILGVARIIWSLPLLTLLGPLYGLVGLLTLFSQEEFVAVAWDSAGVTTGPVTVPLVLAMGLGIGAETGIPDGFGVLALASAFPIFTVLVMGVYVRLKRERTVAAEEAA